MTEYEPKSEEVLFNRLESTLEELIGASGQPGELVTKQLRAEAKTLAENQEQALQRVYKSAYLADATGEDLEKITKLIGISRNEALSATGTVRFSRDSPAQQSRVIPTGTKIQTDELDPKVYTVTNSITLPYIDGFESNTLTGWQGDTGSVSLVSSGALTGNQSLELPASSSVTIRTIDEYTIGTVFEADIEAGTNTVTGIQFGRQSGSNYFEVEIDSNNNDLNIREVESGTEVRFSGVDASVPESTAIHLTVKWGLHGDHRAVLYNSDSKDNEIASVVLSRNGDPVWNTGSVALVSKDNNDTVLVDEVSTTQVTANVKSNEVGVETNVARGAVSDITDAVSGIQEVTNPVPLGNTNYINTNLGQFRVGQDAETDEELRERALKNTAIGGSATATAVSAKVSEVEGVRSVKLFNNRTNTTNSAGLPPKSFEVTVFGGTDEDVAHAIFDSAAVDSNPTGGHHGSATSYTLTSEILSDTETISWSRPVTLNLDITVDLIVDKTYSGDETIRSIIVEYVGGTDVDGSFQPGSDPSEDLYEAVLKQALVDPKEYGVWEVDTLTIDSSGDSTDDTTTLASGADVLAVADGEVAETNARDGSITVNTTQR